MSAARVAVYDENGDYLAVCTTAYADRALARREVARTDTGHLVVIPAPMRELSPDEKRRIVLRAERTANRRGTRR